MSTQQKIHELTNELKKHNYNYYVLANPTISDREFDRKLKELELLEQAFPQYADPNSPTQKVGGDVTKNFVTVPHSTRMLSLGNTYSREELVDFDTRVAKLIGGNAYAYTVELKFDGLAIALRYSDGKLMQAITRGDGTQGDDVTANVKTIRAIPHQLVGDYPSNVEVRGELFMHKAAFHKLNEERLQNGEEAYKNPRNTAAGTIKLQDSAEVAKRPLDGFMYQLAVHGTEELDHYDSLQRMKAYGLPVNEATRLCSTIDDVWNFITQWETKRKKLSFEIDGVVIKVNSRLQQQEMGFTSKFPRWAMSYKFETERAESTLLSISYQVGRTGAVTPVANLEPVQLLGTTVKRASLHNADFIAQLDVRLGDTVSIEKGGEIIPKIVAVDTHKRAGASQPIQFVVYCPECNTALQRPEGDAVYRCPNALGCPPQIKGRIEHFIGRKAMDVDGLGEGLVDLLFEHKFVKKLSDLYSLKVDEILKLRSIHHDKDAIEKVDDKFMIPVQRVIFSWDTATTLLKLQKDSVNSFQDYFVNITANKRVSKSKSELITGLKKLLRELNVSIDSKTIELNKAVKILFPQNDYLIKLVSKRYSSAGYLANIILDLGEKEFEVLNKLTPTRITRYGTKTASAIVKGIDASKKQPFERVLFGLGIRFVGETVAKKLAFHFKNIDALMAADLETLNAINEIGEVIAKSVVDYFNTPANRSEIEELKAAGLTFEVVEKKLVSNTLNGAKIVVSGTFTLFSRDELKRQIEDNGGVNVSSLSKNTDYLIAGDNMGPAKKEKAEKLGIKMLNENEFLKMLATK